MQAWLNRNRDRVIVVTLVALVVVAYIAFLVSDVQPAPRDPGRNGNVEIDDPYRTDNGYW